VSLPVAQSGELILDLGKSEGVTYVGALQRWTPEGKARKPVNPKASIAVPDGALAATRGPGNQWVLRDLPAGWYDLVILTSGKRRIEGFHYPPISEFDPPLPATGTVAEEVREWIVKDIAKARHYENKVTPLYLAGTNKQVRVLVQLVRDKPTSFDRQAGGPVATIRHEVWQYTYWYGGWSKDRSTRVLDRILLPVRELQGWTWLWEPKLGGIEVKSGPVKVTYEVPSRSDTRKMRGWIP
jgi:hypothetical protein